MQNVDAVISSDNGRICDYVNVVWPHLWRNNIQNNYIAFKKWSIIDINMNDKMQLLESNKGEPIHDCGVGKDFLYGNKKQ